MPRGFVNTFVDGTDVATPAGFFGGPVIRTRFDGTVFISRDFGKTFSKTPASGFIRTACSPNGTWVYGVGINGTLWGTLDMNNWFQVIATLSLRYGVEDVVFNYDNRVWIITRNGHLFRYVRAGEFFEWCPAMLHFKRLAIGPGNQFWAIDSLGDLYRADGPYPTRWYNTLGKGMLDVSVSSDGDVWLVRADESVWVTRDGINFTFSGLEGYRSVSAAPSGIAWLAHRDGYLHYTYWLDPPVWVPVQPFPILLP